MLSKRYESTEVDRRTWLHRPSGIRWSTSIDTHQVVSDFDSDITMLIYLYNSVISEQADSDISRDRDCYFEDSSSWSGDFQQNANKVGFILKSWRSETFAQNLLL